MIQTIATIAIITIVTIVGLALLLFSLSMLIWFLFGDIIEHKIIIHKKRKAWKDKKEEN